MNGRAIVHDVPMGLLPFCTILRMSWQVQSAKAALAAALENAEGVREAVAAKEVLEAAQKSSTAAWRSHSVSPCLCVHRARICRACTHVPWAVNLHTPGFTAICRCLLGSWHLLAVNTTETILVTAGQCTCSELF